MSKHLRCLHLVGAGIFLAYSSSAHSAGFAIIENSAAGTGTAYAGAAASTLDASVAWFNPAVMTEFSGRKFSVAGHVVNIASEFENRGTTTNPLLGGDDIEGSERMKDITAFIPNLYYIAPMSSDMTFGLAINAPFGLETNYRRNWVGRYQAVKSALTGVNINPSLAWRLSDELSIGAGLSAQYLDATLSNAVDSGAVCLGTAPNNAARAECVRAGLTAGNLEHDSFAEVSGDGWAFNFNIGLLYKISQQTRFGLHFRSEINHELEGDAKFKNDPTFQAVLDASGSTAFTNTGVEAAADLPASFSISAAHDANEKIQLLADITWTQWSSFEELRVKFDNPAQPDSVTTENWDDTFRYSVGINYKHNDVWTFRSGLAWDEEPIPSPKFRTPRIPGNDRTWIAFGAGYRVNDEVNLDFGFAHLIVDETPLDHTDEGVGHTTRGIFESNINIVSAQLNWHFE